ncbi:hypothetical protein M0804_015182 [Polistes exclamans]|nr:hypothetical protein M0804_015183 [Polistes exclamans]KAI4473773.1 hypothetical protein M0804_015182 [Polistes exclamans]
MNGVVEENGRDDDDDDDDDDVSTGISYFSHSTILPFKDSSATLTSKERVGWLVGSSAGWLVGWLVGLLAGWMVGRSESQISPRAKRIEG